jgi:hypothetical protein
MSRIRLSQNVNQWCAFIYKVVNHASVLIKACHSSTNRIILLLEISWLGCRLGICCKVVAPFFLYLATVLQLHVISVLGYEEAESKQSWPI